MAKTYTTSIVLKAVEGMVVVTNPEVYQQVVSGQDIHAVFDTGGGDIKEAFFPRHAICGTITTVSEDESSVTDAFCEEE